MHKISSTVTLACLLLLNYSLGFSKANAQDGPSTSTINALPPLPPGVTNSSTPIVHKKIRTFAKACPECGTVCVSTNLFWHTFTQTERVGSVHFTCTNQDCDGLIFSEEIKRPIKKSAPMVEVTQ